ncbi:MAG TPA: hypothetical protein VFR07_07390 [Mycobacteriales bacterium]|jgi:hypothetical protein|nr:hypothetical protein [Mycobacteriales bacterium]
MTVSPEVGPAMVVQLDHRWLEVPFSEEVDPGDWAATVVSEGLRGRGLVEPEPVVQLYVQSYALLVERLRARAEEEDGQLAAAYALLSQDDLLPVSVTELWVFSAAMPLDAVVDGVVVDRGERFGEPVVTEIQAPAGNGMRVQQYMVSPGPAGVGPDQQVVETLVVHVWSGPVPDTTVFLSTWFASFVDSELYEPALEAVASSLTWRV